MKHIKGPDFPTGAIVVGRSGIRDAYMTGRGRIVMRARAHIEELRGGKSAIVVTELPYGVKKGGDSGVIKKIAELVEDKVITEISDLADHSDKSGMRIQVELKRDAIPKVVLNKLFKHTALQSTFGANMVALVDGVPRTLWLLELITHYLDHQREVVTRRTQHELRKAESARAHPRGLPDRARAPRRGDRADPRLRRRRGGADRADGDASASPRSRRRRSSTSGCARSRASARRDQHEHDDLMARIAELRAILGDEARVYALIREELLEMRRHSKPTSAARRSRTSRARSTSRR